VSRLGHDAGRVALVAAVSLIAAIAALEVGARWVVPLSDEFFRSDPVVGIHHIEGRTGRWVSPEFDVRVTINSAGFRDRERAREKPRGVRRVIVLGDSMTEAFQVPLEATFAARLESTLHAREPRVEVLNMGLTAIGPAQAYLLYHARARAYSPDVVVMMLFMGNDFRNSSFELEGKPYLRYPVADDANRLVRDASGDVRFTAPTRPGRVREWLRTHAASYRFVRDRLMPGIATQALANAPSDDVLGLYRQPLSASWRRAVDVTLAILTELDRAVQADRARLIVFVLPAPWEVDPSYVVAGGGAAGGIDYRAAEERAAAWLRARGIAVVSGRERFADDIARGGRPYFARDGHLTPHGHALVAERLADVVKAEP
jgi:lysophospholipase L1-like esterase